MRVAVITPSYQTPRAWLDQCMQSVADQSYRCTHFLISDGDEALVPPGSAEVRFLRLPGPHGDAGNAARAAGSAVAICEGFDALAYLDADNWYANDHIQRLVDLQGRTGAAVCSTARQLVDLDSCEMGRCPEVDGVRFVDTSCLFLTRAAFAVVAHWYLMPTAVASVSDRIVWAEIVKAGLTRAHEPTATVFYRTRYAAHYEHFGRKPPPGARRIVVHARRPAPVAGPASAAPKGDRPTARPRVSLCMIVKDEEARLPMCLASIRDLVDEIVVADTGSVDRTREVAAGFGARVVDVSWSDDFAAARNASLDNASGDWVFWLDADERLDEPNRERLKGVFAGLGDAPVGFLMRQLSLPGRPGEQATEVAHLRLFPRDPAVRWEYRVHEQILPAAERAGCSIRPTDVVIQHAGYETPEQRERKVRRNLRLLEMSHADSPSDLIIRYNLGWAYLLQRQPDRAIPHLRASLDGLPAGISIGARNHALLVDAHRRLGEPQQAIAVLAAGRARYPDDIELRFLDAKTQADANNLAAAEPMFLALLGSRPRTLLGGIDPGLHGFKARHELARVYAGQQRPADAAAQWQLVVKEQPGFRPAWLGYAAALLELDRRADFDEALRRARDLPGPAEEVERLAAHAGQLWASSVVSLPVVQPRVSLCMIVRDEEQNLTACLNSVIDLVDEVIVVDTGSTDRTKEIALHRGARVFDFTWVDDFGAARNESLRHANGDWVFWFDADDRLNELNRDRLRTLFRGLNAETAGFVMKYSCLTNATTGAHTLVDQVRLFPNRPQIRWEHRVHEQVLPAIQRLGGQIRWTDVVIDHLGYQDPALCARKHQRNLRLLELEIQEMPDRPFTLFNMGWTLLETGRTAEAIPYLERSLSRCDPRDSIARKLHVLLAKAHIRAGDQRQALECCRRGRETYPDDPELCYHAGLLHFGLGDYRNAAHCLETLLASRPAPYFAIGVEGGVLGYLTRHNLAVVYRDQGRVAEAEAQWRLVVAERPQFQLALVALGELYVVQARWADLEGICQLLNNAPNGAADATLLRARGHLGRREFAEAQVLIATILAQTPAAIWPRLLLSRALCEDGTNPDSARAVLREILALDANHAEARQRLSKLQQQEAGGKNRT